MNTMSQPFTHALFDRAMASAAAVPSTLDIAVVQNATTRLFQAAFCIWVASNSARYQRSDRPSGGNLSDWDAVNDVTITIKLGATSTTIASAASVRKTICRDAASQSKREFGFRIGAAHCG